MQIENSFDKKTIQKMGKGAIIAGSGAILTYFIENIGSVDFGVYTPIVVAALSILVNIFKEYKAGIKI